MVKVLFVCLGNICRSPTAEGVFTKLVRERGLDGAIHIDSAGTIDFHQGEPPDERAQRVASSKGIDISHLRARQIRSGDFREFDYVLAMDMDNLAVLEAMCPGTHRERVRLFCDYAPHLKEREVPDPYFGGAKGFQNVYRIVEAAAQGLLDAIVRAAGK